MEYLFLTIIILLLIYIVNINKKLTQYKNEITYKINGINSNNQINNLSNAVKDINEIKETTKNYVFLSNYLLGLGFEVQVLDYLFKTVPPTINNTPIYDKNNIFWNVQLENISRCQADIVIPSRYGTFIIECKNWSNDYTIPEDILKPWENASGSLSVNSPVEQVNSIAKSLFDNLKEETYSQEFINPKKIIVFSKNLNGLNDYNKKLEESYNNNCFQNKYIRIVTLSNLIKAITDLAKGNTEALEDEVVSNVIELCKNSQRFSLN